MTPKPSFLPATRTLDQNRRLGTGFAVSVVLHFLVMLIQFTMPVRPPGQMPNLDVILVNARHHAAPKEVQALAQANLEGGGDSSENIRATSPLMPQETMREGSDLVDMTRGQPSAMQQPQFEQVLTQEGDSGAAIKPKTPEEEASARQPVSGADAQDSTAMAIKLEAEIDEKTRAYNQRPRKKSISPNVKEFHFAQYFASWRAKAERIGELNYPTAARGKIYGSLMLAVTIRKDGTIKKVDIQRKSKHPVLDEAALKIVARGAPYASFPPDIAKDWDEIEIISTWTFTNNKLRLKTR
ncbi:MAG: TonB family protein [Azoarcus sp.]|jgi:protein TonB|nr:TonB family protein [Azoarcus sp.]